MKYTPAELEEMRKLLKGIAYAGMRKQYSFAEWELDDTIPKPEGPTFFGSLTMEGRWPDDESIMDEMQMHIANETPIAVLQHMFDDANKKDEVEKERQRQIAIRERKYRLQREASPPPASRRCTIWERLKLFVLEIFS